jgi:hypothetical protein
MTPRPERPAPGSHDPRTPTGTLEESAAALWEAMVAARDAEEHGAGDRRALDAFYRTLSAGTLLLPVPPEHGEEARAALGRAVNDDEEVEISVMLARDADGSAVSVAFASFAALAAWAPAGTGSLPLPARIAIANLASSGLPAILDPAGPIPYRFESDELAALAAGRLPGSEEALEAPIRRASVRVRLPSADTRDLERSLAASLAETAVDAAYVVEEESPSGARGLLVGLVGPPGAAAELDVPDGVRVTWLEEPHATQVRAVAQPFYRRGRA